MFVIKKESSEYIENDTFCSYETIRIFGIKLYAKVFTSTSTDIIERFLGKQDITQQREYKEPVIVTGFSNT